MAMKFTPDKVRRTFKGIIRFMARCPNPFVVHPGKDFTRNRKCTFSKMMTSIMSLESHDQDKEIYSIFQNSKSGICREDLVTSSAFVQARGKINEEAFPFLFCEFNKKIPFTRTKDGLHVLGIDGSDINIPSEITECNTFIPYNSKNGGYNQLHLNVAFDLVEQRYSDTVIQGRRNMRETAAACEMVDRKNISGKCLYICDRGYDSFNLMAHIMEAEDFFLIRVKNPYCDRSPYKNFLPEKEGEFDIPIRFILTRSTKKPKKDPQKYKLITNQRTFDFISRGDTASEYPMSMRFIGILLDNGTMEYLLTNLPEKKFPASVIKEYYHLRWKTETSFLFLKYGVALNYFHSIKKEFLMQEIYAKLIMFNFISLLLVDAKIERTDTKYKYKPSFTDAVYVARDFLAGRIKPENVIDLLVFHGIPIRPGREYKRNVKSQRLRTLQHRS